MAPGCSSHGFPGSTQSQEAPDSTSCLTPFSLISSHTRLSLQLCTCCSFQVEHSLPFFAWLNSHLFSGLNLDVPSPDSPNLGKESSQVLQTPCFSSHSTYQTASQLLTGMSASRRQWLICFLPCFISFASETWPLAGAEQISVDWMKQNKEAEEEREERDERERIAFEGAEWTVHSNNVPRLSDITGFYAEAISWHSLLFLLANYEDYIPSVFFSNR